MEDLINSLGKVSLENKPKLFKILQHDFYTLAYAYVYSYEQTHITLEPHCDQDLFTDPELKEEVIQYIYKHGYKILTSMIKEINDSSSNCQAISSTKGGTSPLGTNEYSSSIGNEYSSSIGNEYHDTYKIQSMLDYYVEFL